MLPPRLCLGQPVVMMVPRPSLGLPPVMLPPVLATAAERQRSELSQTGQTFRRWRYLQAINDNISRPSYDIVELRRCDLSGYSWIWSQYDLDRLQRDGVDWVVVQEHPHLSFSNADAPFVDSLAKHPVHIFDPFLSAATPRYDQIDAYYLPVSGFAGVDRAGARSGPG